MTERVKLDIYDYPDGHELTVVPCEYCGTYYEPGGKEHKCKKKPKPLPRNTCNVQILKDIGEYRLQFETTIKENFKKVEKLVQGFIYNKPKTNFDKITESVENLAEFLSNYIDCDNCFKDERLCGASCENEIKYWLQQEAD